MQDEIEGEAHWPCLECRASIRRPQPERSARVRDVPKQAFFELAQTWRQRYQATLVSMQLEGHDEQPVQGLIQAGVLEATLALAGLAANR